MPRAPRIEFEGAIYHVMARGNHREKIVFFDDDRRVFTTTLDEVAAKTGWEIFAWVLMSNHYHLAFRTPQANLVDGMTWFQTTFTQRINARNHLRGHLFSGRYKAILVENQDITGSAYRSDYLTNLIHYIHLNPGRAGLVDGEDHPILDYPWSSLAQWYVATPGKRPSWARVAEALDLFQCKDTVGGRRRYVQQLDETIRLENAEELGINLPEEHRSLQSTLERGWYWGSETFREAILDKCADLIKGRTGGRNERNSLVAMDHAEGRAAKIINLAEELFGLDRESLLRSPPRDQIRPAIARAIAEQTTLSHARIAELLAMKSAGNVSQQIFKFRRQSGNQVPKPIRSFHKKLNLIT